MNRGDVVDVDWPFSDWQGNPLGLNSDGRVVAAASDRLWTETIAAMTGQP